MSYVAPLEWGDALAVADCHDEKYVISSPNMPFIPLAPSGVVEVVLRGDYRYGLVDPIQWPQVYTEEYDYLCAIRCGAGAGDEYSALWWSPSESQHFQVVEGAMFKSLGRLTSISTLPLLQLASDLVITIAKRSAPADPRLDWLSMAMRHACDRVRHFPSTFRDAAMQVREIQRYWLMARAFIDYHDVYLPAQSRDVHTAVVRPELMGTFTTNPAIVQRLFAAGIPVWFIRTDVSILEDTHVHAVIRLTLPTDICLAKGPNDGHVIFKGLSGKRHLAATARGGHTYFDISQAPLLLAVDLDEGYSGPVSQKQYRKRTQEHGAGRPRGTSSSLRKGSHAQGPCECLY